MIKGMHAIFFTPQAEELRAFIRDRLELPYTDVGDGWLIFDVPRADLACHPAEGVAHDISFFCDDLGETVSELKGKGVEFTSDITETDWGWMTTLRMPGNLEVILYQAKYTTGPR